MVAKRLRTLSWLSKQGIHLYISIVFQFDNNIISKREVDAIVFNMRWIYFDSQQREYVGYSKGDKDALCATAKERRIMGRFHAQSG